MDKKIIKSELKIKAARSSGSGGQHVNKVSTKVALHFHIYNSKGLEEEEKQRLSHKLANRISKEGILIVKCQQTRSQLKNKELGINKLFKLLKKGLYVKPIRKKKGISKNQNAKRLKNKREHSEKKALRKSVKFP